VFAVQRHIASSLRSIESSDHTPMSCPKCESSQLRHAGHLLLFSSDSSKISVERLSRLVQLFDRILVDEYTKEDVEVLSSFNLSQSQDEHLICDFCGADIFHSFFQCNLGDECSEGRNEPLIVCSACYVDGRSCFCMDMSPYRLHPFTELLESRQRAIDTLKSVNDLSCISCIENQYISVYNS
jgi:hypothetical protein